MLEGIFIMKKIYTAAWFLLTLFFVATVFTGYFNALSLVVFSLGALALVYALALWTLFVNTPDEAVEQFAGNDKFIFKR